MNAGPPGPGKLTVDRPDPRRRTLSVLGWPISLLLAIEFLLGMTLNLYVALPTGGGAVSILVANPILLVHFLVAFLLLGTVSRATVLAIRLRDRRALGASFLGLVSGVLATLAGLDFVFGGQSAAASWAMSAGFVGLLLTAVLLLSLADPRGLPIPAAPEGSSDVSPGASP